FASPRMLALANVLFGSATLSRVRGSSRSMKLQCRLDVRRTSSPVGAPRRVRAHAPNYWRRRARIFLKWLIGLIIRPEILPCRNAAACRKRGVVAEIARG